MEHYCYLSVYLTTMLIDSISTFPFWLTRGTTLINVQQEQNKIFVSRLATYVDRNYPTN